MAEDGFLPLTHEILCQCLSNIDLVVGGGGFAFTRLDCSNKELTHLGNKVEDYKQLRHVVLTSNKLTDMTATTLLPHLLTLQVDQNEVASLSCMADAQMPWCQKLDFSSNKLKALEPLGALVRLRFASFAGNEIASLEGFGGHPVLEELDLPDNQLTGLEGLGSLAGLRRLNVSGNQLASLKGLDAPVLTKLELSKNQLASLEHIGGAPRCTNLDIRENQLAGEDLKLKELRRLASDTPELRELAIAGNAVVDSQGEGSRAEVLVAAPQIKVIEGEPVTPEDKEAAVARREDLLAQIAEKEREEREAAEAAAAEEAAAKAAEEAAAAEDA